MTETSSNTAVTTTIVEEESEPSQPHLVLKLRKPETGKKVKWTSGTVDNEHMDKKKSKCCCIYEKPKVFGESSSEDEDGDDCDHCHGHKKKCYRSENSESDKGGGGPSENGDGSEQTS